MNELVQIDTAYGRKTCTRLSPNDSILETDFYKSTSGLWEPVPGQITGQPPSPSVEFLRPIDEGGKWIEGPDGDEPEKPSEAHDRELLRSAYSPYIHKPRTLGHGH